MFSVPSVAGNSWAKEAGRGLLGFGAGEEVGAPGLGALQGLLAAPLGDFGVVAGEQDLGDLHAAEVLRTRVLRVLQQAGAEGIVLGGVLVAEDAGEQAEISATQASGTASPGRCAAQPAVGDIKTRK